MLIRFLILLLALVAPAVALGFDFEDVAARAKALADKPYEKPDETLPKALQELSYDEYRNIRFKPERALWRGNKLPFELQFFHPGLYYKQTVKINLIGSDGVRPLRFDPEQFDYGNNKLDVSKLRDIGYAGFRVHFPLNSKDYKDELIVFQGASYFRALGKSQRYGLSARGLAVDTGAPSGEEFPAFTEFWIEWPRAEDRELRIYALLDSKSLSGAFVFQIKPGESSVIEVQSRLYPREKVTKLGIAPLTSMFLFGENQPARAEDYRPEVHDSDGLLLQTDGEWLWRPLVNPRRLLISSFAARNPRGFGLMQRDRNFAHYEDLEARYEMRPSAWITPRGDWDAGSVELVQIPTPDETNDNIVAYWVPDAAPAPGRPLNLQYSLSWEAKTPATRAPLAQVAQTRRGHGWRNEDDGSIRFNIDFEGGVLPELGDEMPVAGVWVGENGELIERQSYRNEVTGGWRVSLRIRREDADLPVEMRVMLRQGKEAISETWAYLLPARGAAADD